MYYASNFLDYLLNLRTYEIHNVELDDTVMFPIQDEVYFDLNVYVSFGQPEDSHRECRATNSFPEKD